MPRRSLCRDEREAESPAFPLPRGNFPPISRQAASGFLPPVSVIPKQVSPRDCSETDERSHFFYLLILICGCLKPIPRPSSASSSRLASPLRSTRSLSVLSSVDLPFSLTELHAQCSQSFLLSLAFPSNKCICTRMHICRTIQGEYSAISDFEHLESFVCRCEF